MLFKHQICVIPVGMKKHWNVLQPDIEAVRKIVSKCQCSPVIATILVNRGLLEPDDVSRFLFGSLKHLRSPFSIIDINKATVRIAGAIENKEKILIFGDYDADGITSTTLLYEFLEICHADVSYYIPHRTNEGYGFQADHVFDVALPQGTDLIITVDCGSNSHAAVDTAARHGIDVIITDHHLIGKPYPSAVAIVNPQRKDCPSGLEHLAGVGVVFYLIIAIRKYFRDKGYWKMYQEPNLKQFCDLVALGTVADLVPVRKENRILVKAGLEVIQAGKREGINALLSTCCFSKTSFDSRDLAFRLAPRLNAAGRMAHANSAFELLTALQKDAAVPLAKNLDQLNIQRQEVEKKLLEEILATIRKTSSVFQKTSLVFWSRDWPEGVLGIVASRLAEQFFRPVVLITVRDGFGKGSARSIPGFHIYEGLCQCRDCLEDFGGHSMAAGIKLKTENIEIFSNTFDKVVKRSTVESDFIPEICIDHEIHFDDISEYLIDELSSLEPWGVDNPEPLFMAKNVAAHDCRIVGRNHRRMMLDQPKGLTGKKFSAIQFNINPETPAVGFFHRLAFRLRWNQWNGKKTVQMVIEDFEREKEKF
jgi:single-stranded-DNA-specific exonuclease